MKPSYPWVLFVERFWNYYFWFSFILIIDLLIFSISQGSILCDCPFLLCCLFYQNKFFSQQFLVILCITVISVVIALLLLIWLTWALVLSLISLAKSLSILFIFLNNQLLVSLIIFIDFWVCIVFISSLIFMISFIQTLGFIFSFFFWLLLV